MPGGKRPAFGRSNKNVQYMWMEVGGQGRRQGVCTTKTINKVNVYYLLDNDGRFYFIASLSGGNTPVESVGEGIINNKLAATRKSDFSPGRIRKKY